jgi:hypothetical protein
MGFQAIPVQLGSPDGRLLARAEKGTLHIWDMTQGRRKAPQLTYPGSERVSPDGKASGRT